MQAEEPSEGGHVSINEESSGDKNDEVSEKVTSKNI